MNTRFLTLLTTLAFLGFTVSAFAKGKPPKPPVDTTVVYTVELTTGVFTFPAHKATLNSKGSLKSFDTESLVIGRPVDGFTKQQEAWDAVIDKCAGPLVGEFTEDVMYVEFDEWGVGRNGDDGNLWISLANIRLPDNLVPEKEIQIQLQLRDDPETTKTFLPTDSNRELSFDLNWYVVWGKPLSGKGKKKGWDTCYHIDVEADVDFLPAELVIAISEEN